MGQKAFVVDDEKHIADAVSLALSAAEFDVETFYDARLALLKVQDCPPDLLVSDIVMPEVDGIMLAEAVRKQNPGCKVILMSGNPDWTSHGTFPNIAKNAFALLIKPFSLSRLLQLVKPDPS